MKHHVRLFMLFALVAAGIGESTATPLLTPYLVKSSIIYEGGYAMNLRVCGNVLCGLNVSTPQRRLQVPKKSWPISSIPISGRRSCSSTWPRRRPA